MPAVSTHVMPGLKPALDLLSSSPERIVKIFAREDRIAAVEERAKKLAIPVEPATAAMLDKICGAGRGNISHQGIATVITLAQADGIEQFLETCASSPLPLAIAFDQVKDPGNLGTLARTAWALGCGGILIPEHNSAPIGPGALRSSAGALALLNICRVANLARALDLAEETGFTIYGAGCHESSSQKCLNAYNLDWNLPAVLVMGSEGKGLRPGVAKRCAALAAIPFARDFDSLNVAQAGAILIALCAARHDRQTF